MRGQAGEFHKISEVVGEEQCAAGEVVFVGPAHAAFFVKVPAVVPDVGPVFAAGAGDAVRDEADRLCAAAAEDEFDEQWVDVAPVADEVDEFHAFVDERDVFDGRLLNA
jgi:hypothetical protein